MRYQAGLSLLELLVVIAIIGIVSGFAAPSMSEWNCKRELRKDFDVLVGALSTARVEAISRKTKMMVTGEPRYSGISKGVAFGIANSSCNSITSNRVQEQMNNDPSTNTMCFKPDGDVDNPQSRHLFELARQCGSQGKRYSYMVTITSFGHLIKEYLPPGGSQWLEI